VSDSKNWRSVGNLLGRAINIGRRVRESNTLMEANGLICRAAERGGRLGRSLDAGTRSGERRSDIRSEEIANAAFFQP